MSSDAEADCSASAPDKPKLPSEVWVLITANVVIALGYGVVAPVLPQYARNFGVSISAATFVITAFSLMRLLAAPASGLIIQRLGERRVYLTGLLIVAVSTGACAFAQTYWQLLLFRSLGGLGSAMFTVSSLGLMIRISPTDARGRVAGMFSSAFLDRLGVRAGSRQPHGRASGSTRRSPSTGWRCSSPSRWCSSDCGIRRSRRPRETTEPPVTLGIALRNRAYRSALFSNFSTGWSVFGLRIALVPLFVTEVLMRGPRVAGLRWPRSRSATSAATIPSGYLSDRIGRRRLLIVGLAASGVSTVLVGLAARR